MLQTISTHTALQYRVGHIAQEGTPYLGQQFVGWEEAQHATRCYAHDLQQRLANSVLEIKRLPKTKTRIHLQ